MLLGERILVSHANALSRRLGGIGVNSREGCVGSEVGSHDPARPRVDPPVAQVCLALVGKRQLRGGLLSCGDRQLYAFRLQLCDRRGYALAREGHADCALGIARDGAGGGIGFAFRGSEFHLHPRFLAGLDHALVAQGLEEGRARRDFRKLHGIVARVLDYKGLLARDADLYVAEIEPCGACGQGAA